ncbi:isoprenylcysteine carboxyl methyltransferase family protein [Paenibacillus turpanensis]|uniref:isoprenylcysteine carboxyl methyltransferase family protein n=1 Tax=Paenibacillus turpanensis TaxID=2689078 RepID=UPI00140DB2D3|nr:isoprenylcysteine carboxylmethyltransferase family protein [Paenibacillus turpanensis]
MNSQSLFFLIVLAIVVLQRMIELRIAKSNEARVTKLGGYEAGADHYHWFFILHSIFLISVTIETAAKGFSMPVWWTVPFAVFLSAQSLRVWCIRTLGMFWNTKIIVLPGTQPIRRGPYRLLRHPNYLVVALELVSLPLIFGATYTALWASAANIILLRKRIAVEEDALESAAAQHKGVQDHVSLS